MAKISARGDTEAVRLTGCNRTGEQRMILVVTKKGRVLVRYPDLGGYNLRGNLKDNSSDKLYPAARKYASKIGMKVS